MNVLNLAFGGEVDRAAHKEFGPADVAHRARSTRCSSIGGRSTRVWMSHGDRMTRLGAGLEALAQQRQLAVSRRSATASAPIYGAAVPSRGRPQRRRARDPAQLRAPRLRRAARLDDGALRRRAGCRASASGSGEAGVRLRALGRRRLDGRRGARPPRDRRPLTCIFVDNGLLRAGRGRRRRWRSSASAWRSTSAAPTPGPRFLENLAGVDDPERKRRIIGVTFIEVFEEEATQLAGRRRSSPRARSIPTSSSRSRCAGRRPPSRATTTSAACPSA